MFHVFVEGAKDGSPAGLERLAKAMAGHYGLPPADMVARLASGRFRAKGNCDRATAEQYVRDLERLGARCTIEPAVPGSAGRASTPSILPATMPAPKPAATPTKPPQFASGLAAAFSGEHAPADLGAFDKLGGDSLSLASVDGSDGGPAASAFVPPPIDAAPAPAATPNKSAAKPVKPERPKDEPLDLFVPPDAAGDELKVELADDEVERAAKKRASVPPATEPVPPAPAPAARISSPSLPPVTAVAAPVRRGNLLGDERVRFVAGVLLAIVLGFVPAHVVASVRETAAYAAVDGDVESAQQDAQTPDTYEMLDARRAELLGRKYDDRRTIAVTALLIWAACGAGIAFVWFRKIRWDRVS
ncbi:MAG TPA: hypothetical protein VGF94_15875 [Kofleriaceae bacterium]|jgi:hypothetical protein